MSQQTYDRQERETTKAYQAFTIYRNMGSSRSLDRTALGFYPTIDSPQKRPRNIAQIEVWSRKYHWVERCKDFDRDKETILRECNRQADIEEHDRKLEQFRVQNETIGFGLLGLGEQLLETILLMSTPIREKLSNGKALEKAEVDLLLAIPSVVRSIGNFGITGSQLAADGLLIRQLMEKLKETEIQSN
jgi:hypothetical protein